MFVKRMVQMAAVCLISSLFAAADAHAQNAQVRQGFWFSGGLGYGSLGCQDCSDREGALSADLSIGGTISPRFLLGVGASGWSKNQQGGTLTVGLVDARVRFYPSARGGLFLTGGIGVGSVQAKVNGFGTATETGPAAILGLGYDYRVSSNMSVTPYWNAFAMKNDYMDANVGSAGIAITLH